MANNKKNLKNKPKFSEINEIYEQEIRTVYSPSQINTIGGTMGGTRGTLGSNRGDVSAAPRGGILPQERKDFDLGEQKDMINYQDFNNKE